MTQIDGAQAEQLAADVTALIDSGTVTMHAPAEDLVRDGAKAYQVKTGGEEHQITSVTFPISGSYSEPLSNLTVLFNTDGAVVQYSETLFSQANSGNLHVISYVDGALTNSEDTGIPAMGAELGSGPETAAQNTTACLATVLGVSGGVAAAMAYACAGSCAVPMTPVTGPVCAACIGGFAAVGGASIGAVASCC